MLAHYNFIKMNIFVWLHAGRITEKEWVMIDIFNFAEEWVMLDDDCC